MVLYFDSLDDWNRPNFQPRFEQFGDFTVVKPFVPEPLPEYEPLTEFEIEGFYFDSSRNPLVEDPWRKIKW